MAKLDAEVQARIDADADFQTSIAELSDEEKDTKLSEKREEVREAIFEETSGNAAKNAQIAEDQRKRAEKAEAELKGKGGKKKEGGGDNGTEPDEERLSDADMYALRHADIHPDDLEEVVKAAKLLGKKIPEALSDDMVKSILAKRVEHRKSGNATDPGAARGGTKRRSDAEVLADFQAGKLPEPGTPEAEQLYRARRGLPSKK